MLIVLAKLLLEFARDTLRLIDSFTFFLAFICFSFRYDNHSLETKLIFSILYYKLKYQFTSGSSGSMSTSFFPLLKFAVSCVCLWLFFK